ncbi:radical SAM protein [Candidatus Atribacteria bacterium HGW-Atribacteria-1]|nr:MAG: radical SAM protein [Candidatus Atribacteria bacterium HGW-Atribacteria-1]
MKLIKTTAKNIYTKTKIPSINYVINQYVGCEHNCAYCYAKFMCRWKPKSHGEWGEWVEAKMNAPELAKKFIKGAVAMSSVSDDYQPIEKELKLTHKVLKNMDKRTDLSILTKSDLVLRDIDLFKKFDNICVGMTINTFEGKEKELFEPNSPSNEARLKALRILKKNGIKTHGFISPVIPGLIDLENLIANSRDYVDYYIVELLNLNAGGYEFKKLLRDNYPESYEIMTNKELFEKFREEVKEILINSGIKVPQLVTHFPKFECVNLN